MEYFVDDIYKKLQNGFNFVKNINDMKAPLTESWGSGTEEDYVWYVPPHKNLEAHVKKAYEESKNIYVIMLLPINSNEAWWHKYCAAGAIFYIQGAVKYKKNRAAIPSAIVMLGNKIPKQTFHVELQ